MQGHVVFQPAGITAPLSRAGSVQIEKGRIAEDNNCLVIPTDGHWTTKYNSLGKRRKFLCSRASASEINWWRSICGLSSRGKRQTTFKVGILDTGFLQIDEAGPTHIDLNGSIVDHSEDHRKYHGYNIYHILRSVGVFKESNIIFSDISSFFDKEKASLYKLVSSIFNMVDVFNVDFINISYGTYFNDLDPDDVYDKNYLLSAIEYARSMGCIVFAAVGNYEGRSPACPASSDDTIGVGAIGKSYLAPPDTLGVATENRSSLISDAHGSTSNGEKVFHDVTTCHGKGVDLVAPGVSVFVQWSSQHTIELIGTSFACPIALGSIAAILARDVEFGTLALASRYQYVKERLPDWCQNLGLSRTRQGHGLAVFVEM